MEVTYKIFGDFGSSDDGVSLSREEFDIRAKEAGMIPARAGATQVSIVFTSQFTNTSKFDKRSFEIQSIVKNVLDRDSHAIITNKKRLHDLVYRRFGWNREDDSISNHFMETWPLSNFIMPRGGGIFITRPSTIGFFGGRGIERITSQRELTAVMKKWRKAPPEMYNGIIVTRYCDSPYLFDGRKFHLRMYLAVFHNPPNDPVVEWFGENDSAGDRKARSKILTAALPYVHGDYDNGEIHDTHMKSTERSFFYPADCEHIHSESGDRVIGDAEIGSISQQMRAISAFFATELREIRPYAESRTGYEIFGVDALLARDDSASAPRVIVMEVNDRVGYAAARDGLDAYYTWRTEMVRWQVACARRSLEMYNARLSH